MHQAQPQQGHPQPHYPQPAYPQSAYPQSAYPQEAHVPQAAAPAQYEFSPDENRTIGTTAGRVRGWGIISLLLGLAQLAISQSVFSRVSPLAMSTQIAGGIVGIVVGAVFISVATSLQAVVTSRGNDITLMMNAMRKLGAALLIQIVVAIGGFVLGFVFGAAGMA